MKKLALFGCLMLAVGLVFGQNDSRGYVVKVGDKAPDFTIQYLDGSTKQLSELRGKTIMLQFTASWCGVCRKEMPHIESDIQQKYKDNPNFVLIGIDLKETQEKTADFARLMKITYPLALDLDGSIFNKYAEKNAGVTRNVIIDKEGNVVFLTRLYDPVEFEAMKKKIAELLED